MLIHVKCNTPVTDIKDTVVEHETKCLVVFLKQKELFGLLVGYVDSYFFSKLHAHVIHIIGRYYRWFFFIKPTKESTSTTSHNCQSIIKSTKNIVVFTRGGIPYIPLYPLIICYLSASESLKMLNKQLELFICLD